MIKIHSCVQDVTKICFLLGHKLTFFLWLHPMTFLLDLFFYVIDPHAMLYKYGNYSVPWFPWYSITMVQPSSSFCHWQMSEIVFVSFNLSVMYAISELILSHKAVSNSSRGLSCVRSTCPITCQLEATDWFCICTYMYQSCSLGKRTPCHTQ